MIYKLFVSVRGLRASLLCFNITDGTYATHMLHTCFYLAQSLWNFSNSLTGQWVCKLPSEFVNSLVSLQTHWWVREFANSLGSLQTHGFLKLPVTYIILFPVYHVSSVYSVSIFNAHCIRFYIFIRSHHLPVYLLELDQLSSAKSAQLNQLSSARSAQLSSISSAQLAQLSSAQLKLIQLSSAQAYSAQLRQQLSSMHYWAGSAHSSTIWQNVEPAHELSWFLSRLNWADHKSETIPCAFQDFALQICVKNSMQNYKAGSWEFTVFCLSRWKRSSTTAKWSFFRQNLISSAVSSII